MRKFVFVSDNHGDMVDRKALSLFQEFLSIWKPDVRIHGGDNWDFRAFRKGADSTEKKESLTTDFDRGVEFLEMYQPHVLLRGNHDERLWDQAEKLAEGPMKDMTIRLVQDAEAVMKRLQCQMLPYHKREGILRIGKMKFAHGFGSGAYAVRRMAQAYGSVLMGHVHRVEVASVPGAHSGNRAVARSCGALCRLDMDYNRNHIETLSQAHGWAYGTIGKSGRYQVFQAEIIDGTLTFPAVLKTIGGRL